MVYQNNLVAVIKVNGKVLREKNGAVAIPFGSEYSIFIKNLSTVRAIANVSVDGTDVTNNTGIIVPPKGFVELERSISNGNLDKGNSFKFIERTPAIEEHRGVGAEDGLVRIEYKFEEQPQQTITSTPPWYTVWNNPLKNTVNMNVGMNGDLLKSTTAKWSGGVMRSRDRRPNGLAFTQPPTASTSYTSSSCDSTSCNFTDCFTAQSVEEAGITVPGSESNQKFTYGAWFPTESTSHVLVLKLVGKVQGAFVAKPVTVQIKPVCVTCGRTNKATHKFCGRCGTALQLF